MKVVGLGEPHDVQIRFNAAEVNVLVDVLREQRAAATRAAAVTYTSAPEHERAVDDRHDRLRAMERLLMQLEEQPPDDRPAAVLVGPTALMCEVVHDGAREAIRRLAETQERYEDHTIPEVRDALLDAAETARAWVATLTALDRVDRGWDAV